VTAWRVHEQRDLRALREVWAAAAAAAPEPHVFQRWELAQAWMTVFGASWACQIVWRDAPPLVLPLVVDAHGTWSLLGNGLFDFCDGLGAPDLASLRELTRFLSHASGHAGVAWERFNVTGIRDDSLFLQFWRALPIHFEPYTGAPRVPGRDAAAWESQHPRIADRFRTALRHGWRMERLVAARARMQLLHRILAWKDSRQRALGQPNVLGEREQAWLEQMVARYPDLAELWGWGSGADWQAGFLCWNDAEPGGGAWRRGYTLAFDPAAASRSPGSMLLFGVMRHSLGSGCGFDLLTGEQDFKRRFATASIGLHCVRGPARAEKSEC